MTKVVLYPLNDNEKKGLPADIDLLEQAIQQFKAKPSDERRNRNLCNLLIRVLEQVKFKLRCVEVDVDDNPSEIGSDINDLSLSIQVLKTNPNENSLIYRLHNDINDVLALDFDI